MPKTPDQSTKQFTFRSGVGGFPTWKGFNSARNSDMVEKNQFTEAINVVPEGSGGIKERGGQSRVCTALTGTVSGIFDPTVYMGSAQLSTDPPATFSTLHTSYVGNNTAAPSDIGVISGSTINLITGTTAPFYSACAYWESQNQIVYGTGRSAAGNVELRAHTAYPAAMTEPVTLCTVAISGSSSSNRITGIAVGSDDKVYFAVYASGINTKIYTWDGVTVTMVKDTGRVGLEAYVTAINDTVNGNYKIAVTYNAIGNPVPVDHLTIGGAWATKTYAFGNSGVSNFGAATMFHLNISNYDMFAFCWTWTVGATNNLMSYLVDPVDMSLWSSRATTGTGTGETYIGVAPSNGILYVAWGATRLGTRWISKFVDGGPGWTDNYSSLDVNVNGGQVPVGMQATSAGTVYYWGGDGHLYKSQGTNLNAVFTDLGALAIGGGPTHQHCMVMSP